MIDGRRFPGLSDSLVDKMAADASAMVERAIAPQRFIEGDGLSYAGADIFRQAHENAMRELRSKVRLG